MKQFHFKFFNEVQTRRVMNVRNERKRSMNDVERNVRNEIENEMNDQKIFAGRPGMTNGNHFKPHQPIMV